MKYISLRFFIKFLYVTEEPSKMCLRAATSQFVEAPNYYRGDTSLNPVEDWIFSAVFSAKEIAAHLRWSILCLIFIRRSNESCFITSCYLTIYLKCFSKYFTFLSSHLCLKIYWCCDKILLWSLSVWSESLPFLAWIKTATTTGTCGVFYEGLLSNGYVYTMWET